MSSDKEYSALLARIETLEKRNRITRMVVSSVGIAILLTVVVGAGKSSQKATVLEGNSLVLRNSKGDVRVRIDAASESEIRQVFFDSNGNERIALSIDDSDIARMKLYDDKGKERITQFTYPSTNKVAAHKAGLTVAGRSNARNEGITLATYGNGDVFQSIFDKNGKVRVSLGTTKDSLAFVELLDKDGENKPAIQLGTTPGGAAYQTFFGANGKKQIAIDVANGVGRQYFCDSEETNRLGFVVTESGIVAQNMLDENGTLRMQNILIPEGTEGTARAKEGYAGVFFQDKRGVTRADTITYGNGEVGSQFYDIDGKIRMSIATHPDKQAALRHFDRTGALRQFSGTYASGDGGHAILTRNGTTKYSVTLSQDDELSFYREKSSTEKAWNATSTLLDVLDVGERLGLIGNDD